MAICTWTILFIIISAVTVGKGQDLPVHKLCEDLVSSVKPDSSGIIEYKQRVDQHSSNCTLLITGFEPDQRINLSGVGFHDSPSLCVPGEPYILVNDRAFYVKKDASVDLVTHGVLNVTVISPFHSNFSFEYHSDELCEDPPIVENANLVTQSLRTFGSAAIYHCKEGFTRSAGDGILYCRKNGDNMEWTGSMLTCKGSVPLDVMVGVTVSVGLVLIFTSTALTAFYFRRYSGHGAIREDKEGGELVDVYLEPKNPGVLPRPPAEDPLCNAGTTYASSTPSEVPEYEDVEVECDSDGEYEKLQ